MFLSCVRDGLRQGQTAVLTQLLLLTIARCVIFKIPTKHFLRILAGVAQPEVAVGCCSQRGVLSLQVGSHSGLPITNSLNGRWHLPILFRNAHLLPLLLPLIYTGSSPIDSSVKRQYITVITST